MDAILNAITEIFNAITKADFTQFEAIIEAIRSIFNSIVKVA